MGQPFYRLLEVDLSTGERIRRVIPEETRRAFLGGAGLAAALLAGDLKPDLDPFSPEAPLLFATGPLTGTAGPAVGRYVVCGKSPATGYWAESNAGGSFGVALRLAGVDALLLRGVASAPSYLWICDGDLELRDARHLWGIMDTYETQAAIRNELGPKAGHIVCIGLAGERRLPFGLILGDHGRVAGRAGMGALMGSKKLKAIAASGKQRIPIADHDAYAKLRSRINRELRSDLMSQGLRDFGTGSGSDVFDYFGVMPKRYFRAGTLAGVETISGPTMAETILAGVSACHGCVIACGRKVKLEDGEERKGPEYESIVGFGPNLGITDLAAITRLAELCDRYGMDTISISNTLGLAMALVEDGVLDGDDWRALDLHWGDAQAVEKLIHSLAHGQGLGAWLEHGARALAEKAGAPETAVEVKGLELAYHDPRGSAGMALVYATSPRGACHNQGPYYLVELGQTREEVGVGLSDRRGGPEIAANVARQQDWVSLLNNLVMCIFANVPAEDIQKLVNSATGFDYTLEALIEVGERSWHLKRLINGKLGAVPGEDSYPAPLTRPLEDGGAAGFVPPFEEMLEAYYHVRGWDARSGMPTGDTLRRLGLQSEGRNP